MDEKQALNFLENVSVCHNCECWYEEPRNHIGGCYRNFTDKKRNCDLRNIAVEVLRKQQYYQWIPCSERKPKAGVDVLLRFEKNLAVGFYSGGIWNIHTGNGIYIGLFEDEDQPIEWMPFPEVD